MKYQAKETFVMILPLVQVITNMIAINHVNAEAQQFASNLIEINCPKTTDDFERVNSDILQEIGTIIERSVPTPTETNPLYPYTCNGTPGWKQVVFINMADTSYSCPPGLSLTSYSKRTCGRAHTDLFNCSSTTFSVGGSEYSRVCGRIRGYQVGLTSAFDGYLRTSHTLEGQYVDGVSLTNGIAGRRKHIWTYAAGRDEVDNEVHASQKCPCDVKSPLTTSPAFVGSDFLCESGADVSTTVNLQSGVFFPDDPLWDGQNCLSTSTCCQFNNPPWFTRNLPNPTTDDIELRLCLGRDHPHADVPLELIELYVQ